MGNIYHVNDNELYLRRLGEGKPLFFLHGGPGSNHKFFLPHMLPLKEHMELIFYDQAGCGASKERDDQNYSMNQEVENLELLRKTLGFQKISLFGESWGSMLALLYATKYPKYVDRILLTAAIGLDSKGLKHFGKELENRLLEKDKLKLDELEKQMDSGINCIKEMEVILDKYYVYDEATILKKENGAIKQIVNQKIGMDMENNYNVRPNLHHLKSIPIMVAQGEKDLLSPNLINQLLVEPIPHAQLETIPKCGHWTVVEQSETMINLARTFFNDQK